jgi:hypothetical protein
MITGPMLCKNSALSFFLTNFKYSFLQDSSMNEKAQGLSLNTIIIGAIVLIVLIVLIGLFTGFFSKFTPDFVSSTEKTCPADQIKSECDYSAEKQVVGRFNPPLDEGKVCCKLITCEDLPKSKCVGEGVGCGSGFSWYSDLPKCKDVAKTCCIPTR